MLLFSSKHLFLLSKQLGAPILDYGVKIAIRLFLGTKLIITFVESRRALLIERLEETMVVGMFLN